MQSARWVLVVLAAIFVTAAPGVAPAQQADPYVSCVRCHALPAQQAQAQMGMHGTGYPPTPESACGICHDTGISMHEQNPEIPAPIPYFWAPPRRWAGSEMTDLCLSCHGVSAPLMPEAPAPGSHPNDVFPYFDATPPQNMLIPPTSVLPLFDDMGQANQDPSWGGLVCSSCHDPHDPSYVADGKSMFLRVGEPYNTAALCGQCHSEMTPYVYGDNLVIPSTSTSVSFHRLTSGQLQIDFTVRNRGNAPSSGGSAEVSWVDDQGQSFMIGFASLPFGIPPEQEAVVSLPWMPGPNWTYGAGFYIFRLPFTSFQPMVYAREFVRAANVTPPPENVRVLSTGSMSIDLAWDPPASPEPVTFDVYRDGMKINLSPVYAVNFTDWGLAPETPHVYTVTAVSAGGAASEHSNRVGAATQVGIVVRVPHDYLTIQDAIAYASPGTSIHVAPGTYTEIFSLLGRYGITVKGQDANGCILDYGATPYEVIDLGLGYSAPDANTLSGFTIRGGGQVFLGAGDVVTGCIFTGYPNPPVNAAGGFLAQNIFDSAIPAAQIQPGGFLAAANSIFFSGAPFLYSGPPAAAALLLNNDFVSWPLWTDFQGSGNFMAWPEYELPGPPQVYFTTQGSPTTDLGLPLGAAFNGAAPDVGVFEVGRPYTPQPPRDLTATFLPGGAGWVTLDWTPPADAMGRVLEYRIYRSTIPDFPPGSEASPLAFVSGATTTFGETAPPEGTTYYYQVRAWAGVAPAPPPPVELLSAASNTVSATYVNRPPVATDDAVTTPEDLGVTIPVLLNDTDPDGDSLLLETVTQPLHGSAVPNPDGSVTYSPAADYFGPDSFAYVVGDGRGGAASNAVYVTVTPVNDDPVAVSDSYTVFEDATLDVVPPGVLANDSDVDGDGLNAIPGAWTLYGLLQFNPNGSFSYTPAADFNGSDAFTYRLSDGHVVTGDVGVTISVTPVNDAPGFTKGPDQTVDEGAGPQGVAGWATEVKAGPADESGQAPTFLVANDNPALFSAQPVVTPDGTLLYAPAAMLGGSATVTVTLTDNGGTANGGVDTSAPQTFTITVNGAPVASPQTVTTAEDMAAAVTLTGLDVNGDALTFQVVTGPMHGTITGDPPYVNYEPEANYNGPDSFAFTASDGRLTSAPVTVTITVTPVNDAPLPIGQGVTTAEDAAVSLTLQAGDVDGDALTYAVVSAPAHGTLSGEAPNLTYTPAADYNGPDSFTFTASDGQLTSVPGWVAITVTPLNDAPIAHAGPDQNGTAGQELNFSGAASSDIDGTIVSYVWNWGDGTADGSGVTAPHAFAAAGAYTVTLTVTDNDGASATDTTVVTVAPVNLALGRPAYASTTRLGYPAANAVDGSGATSWMSNKANGTQWLYVDLGSSRSVSTVKVFWQDVYFAKSFRIETSSDKKTWTPRYSTTAGAGGVSSITFTPVNARYMRLACTKANNSSYYGVTEFEVYE